MLNTYLMVRIISAAVFAVILLVFMLKRKKKEKKLNFMNFLAIVAVFFAITSFLPVENLFVKFDSAQKVFNYINNKPVAEVLDTEDFSVLLYRKNINAYDAYTVKKSGNGYKLPFGFNDGVKNIEMPYELPNLSVKLCKLGSGEESVLVVFEYRSLIDDYNFAYSDTQGNEFKQLEKRIVGEENETVVEIYFVKIDSSDKNYKLLVDNNGIVTEININ